jgi:hypothetical protein
MTMDSGPTTGPPIGARPQQVNMANGGPMMTSLPSSAAAAAAGPPSTANSTNLADPPPASTPTSGGTTTATAVANNSNRAGSGQQHLCHGCGKRIGDRYLLKAMDVFWHEDCLKCGCCDCRLGEVGSSLYTKANLILCKRDYLR